MVVQGFDEVDQRLGRIAFDGDGRLRAPDELGDGGGAEAFFERSGDFGQIVGRALEFVVLIR